MTESYMVRYSEDALDDLKEIYAYIANELLVQDTATAQVKHIRKRTRALNFMPARYTSTLQNSGMGTLTVHGDASITGG